MMERLLTLNEVARNLGCTVACLRRWRREGKLGVVKLSRLVRVPEAECARIAREGIRPRGRKSR